MIRPQAVIFDNDGLLLDTEEAWTRAERTLFARRGQAFTIEHKRSLIGSALPDAALKLEAMLGLRGQGEELMDELHELVMEEALAGVAPRPGALELLEDSPAGVAAAAAAGMYVIGVPYLEGSELTSCDLTAGSLADPAVAAALGLGGERR